ncbi:hypothetical protein [Fortiea contorta]|uniref:hypothetical protein n=1 Tax=Fortiea contorta TaxID=1892405 RepID=UPI00034C7B6F|nr:hypothetical protein [Fortiea contorta]
MSNTPQEFNNPGNSNPQESFLNETGTEGFLPPGNEESLQAEAAAQALQEILSQVDPDLLSLKDEIEKSLVATTQAIAASATSAREAGGSNIVGVGIGSPDAQSILSGLSSNPTPGKLSLNIYTIDTLSTEQLLSELSAIAGTRALTELSINQIPTGHIDALNQRARFRPAPGGVSVGHFAITAGTLGALSRGNRAPRSSRLLILSNNHVLANSNSASVGDAILQPGRLDGGNNPADQVAILESWVPINFAGGANYVDAATAWAWPDRVRPELKYESGGSEIYFRINSTPVAPTINQVVGKTGRTTNLTQGRITDLSATINVNYGGGRVALFRDQLTIQSTSGSPFSAGGDSGSLIWTWDNRWAPVGLLFAGGGGYTFANKIQRVLAALDINLYT